MNDWKSDEALYASALAPNKQVAKEIEQLKEEVRKLTREITALRKEKEYYEKRIWRVSFKKMGFAAKSL